MAKPPDKKATAAAQRVWLRALPRLTGGKSLGAIAGEIGVSRSTLSDKISKSDNGISLLRSDVIDKIVARYSVPGPSGPAGGGAFREDAEPYVSEKTDPLAGALQALIAGNNALTVWTLQTRALELAGYLPGDVVLVDLNATPTPGDAVCAQIYDWPKMKAETVMRIFHRATPVDLISTRSLDPALQRTDVVDGEHVIIKGVLLPHRLRGPIAA